MALITPDEENNDKGSSYLLITYIVLTFVAALKGIHRTDSVSVRECNSLKNFALSVINKESQVPSGNLRLISPVFSKFSKHFLIVSRLGQFWVNIEKIRGKLTLNCPWAHAITDTNK